MKIECSNSKTSSLPPEILENYKISYETFFLEEGKKYTVYAIRIYLGYIWYCVCDEGFVFYPTWIPSLIFKITDARLSRHWIFGLEDEKSPFLSFPEWVNDPYFYRDLVDGDSKDTNALVFRKYKEIMSLEFPDPSISETATIGDQEWLICPSCNDAWQSSNNEDALVRCTQCQRVSNNPRYQPKQISPS